MAYKIIPQADGTHDIHDETGRVVDEGLATYNEAADLIAMYDEDGEGDDVERKRNAPDGKVFVNLLVPGSEAMKRAEANELAFDGKLAADAEAGRKVLLARGVKAEDIPWTAIEKRVAAADLTATEPEVRSAPEEDWRAAAQTKLDSIDLTLDGHETPEAWLAAARARCDEIEVELRSSTAEFTH